VALQLMRFRLKEGLGQSCNLLAGQPMQQRQQKQRQQWSPALGYPTSQL
jgi:hypothetical protein